MLASLGAAAVDLLGTGVNLIAYYCTVGLVGGPIALVYTQGRAEFTLDFELGLFMYCDNSNGSRLTTTSGPMSDISCIRITTKPDAYEYTEFITRIDFRPELKRESFRMDHYRCSVPIRDFADRVHFCLELAERLQMPVYDDSGWQGWRPPRRPPEMCVIQPGQPHPVWLLPKKLGY